MSAYGRASNHPAALGNSLHICLYALEVFLEKLEPFFEIGQAFQPGIVRATLWLRFGHRDLATFQSTFTITGLRVLNR